MIIGSVPVTEQKEDHVTLTISEKKGLLSFSEKAVKEMGAQYILINDDGKFFIPCDGKTEEFTYDGKLLQIKKNRKSKLPKTGNVRSSKAWEALTKKDEQSTGKTFKLMLVTDDIVTPPDVIACAKERPIWTVDMSKEFIPFEEASTDPVAQQ